MTTVYDIGKKRREALISVDHMSAELRACVHDLGLPIVTACLKYGVKSPAAIRDLTREIWSGARQSGQKTGAHSTLDWLLMQSGADISARALQSILSQYSMVITSCEPSRAMLDASMRECSEFRDRVTKEEKHRRRLRAALRVAIKETPSAAHTTSQRGTE